MGKSSSVLITGVLGAIAVVVVLIWWVGPAVVNLAVFDGRRDQPYTQLDFARAEDLGVYRSRYQAPLAALVASENGVMVDRYQLVHLMHGKSADEWPLLNRIHMAQAKDLVQVITAAPYRLMQDYVTGLESLQFGSFTPPKSSWRAGIVLLLVQNLPQTSADPLAPVLSLLPRGTGQIVWDAQVTVTHAADPWDRVVVIDFADAEAALAWLRDADVITAHALSDARSARLVVSIYQRDATALADQ